MKHLKMITVIMVFVMIMPNVSGAEYIFSESPQDFTDFLESCTDEERVLLLQSLKALPNLKDEYFGTLKGLPDLENFTANINEVTQDTPLKPKTFNEVPPVTVISAIDYDIIDDEEISAEAVRKALVYRTYNKLTYPFRDDKSVDYHSIVKWAAKESGISEQQVNNLSTFYLESRIAEKYFEEIWDKLSHEQRIEFLNSIEKESGVQLNKEAISAMKGAAVLAALQAAISIWGLPTITATALAVLAKILSGPILAFIMKGLGYAIGAIFSPLGWLLTTPAGWGITAIIAGTGIYHMGSAEKETVSAFILTVNLIKVYKYQE